MATVSSPIGLQLRWEHQRGVLHVRGELDLSSGAALHDGLRALLDAEPHATVDLAEVTFADLRGLDPLLEAMTTQPALRVRNVPRSVTRLAGVLPRLADVLGRPAAA